MTSNDAGRIRYDEGCLAAHSLNLVGDRWALLVVRELMFSPKRFQSIRAGVPGITASVLTARLTQLQQAQVLVRDDRLASYALTDAGRDLLPVLESLCRWALRVPGHDPRRFISPSALMISMGVKLRPDAAKTRIAVAGFEFHQEAFEVALRAGRLHVTAVTVPQAPFVLKGTGNALARAVYGPQALAQLVNEAEIEVQGDPVAAQAFVDRFALAAPAA